MQNKKLTKGVPEQRDPFQGCRKTLYNEGRTRFRFILTAAPCTMAISSAVYDMAAVTSRRPYQLLEKDLVFWVPRFHGKLVSRLGYDISDFSLPCAKLKNAFLMATRRNFNTGAGESQSVQCCCLLFCIVSMVLACHINVDVTMFFDCFDSLCSPIMNIYHP